LLPASKTTTYEVRFSWYWEEEIVGIKKTRKVMSLIRNSMLVVLCGMWEGKFLVYIWIRIAVSRNFTQ